MRIERDCPACAGIGWQRVDVPIADPRFGKLFPCELCGKNRRAAWLEQVCRLSPEMRTWRLSGFKPRNGTGDPASDLRTITKKGQGWVVLSGPPGTGKTFLLAAMANEARLLGMPAVYITTADLLADLRDCFHPTSGQMFSSLFNSVMGAAVLCLDELEKFRATPWAEEQFFRLVDQRYREWDQRLTVIATNRHIDKGVQLLDETNHPGYVESRLGDGRFKRLDFWSASDARPVLRA